LGLVARQVRLNARVLETREVEPSLVRARLADHYRDLELEPLPPGEFDRFVSGLGVEAWRRLALAVAVLDQPAVLAVLATLAGKVPLDQQVQVGFVGLARDTDALHLSLIRQSDVRAEEFARHFAAHLGVAWRGETPEQSQNRLAQLDYKRLLAEVEKAKLSAEERMEYLRKKQEEAARQRPRGKL
jgi:hypothetical protein